MWTWGEVRTEDFSDILYEATLAASGCCSAVQVKFCSERRGHWIVSSFIDELISQLKVLGHPQIHNMQQDDRTLQHNVLYFHWLSDYTLKNV